MNKYLEWIVALGFIVLVIGGSALLTRLGVGIATASDVRAVERQVQERCGR